MQMQSLFIRNLRSIEVVEIKECGEFNVLIDKNNAGKSNILSAIDFYFRVLKTGELLTTKSPVSKAVDFHNQDTGAHVSARVGFAIEGREGIGGTDGTTTLRQGAH
jgi:putative ATP-dependent endonuclease of OLD family